MNPDCSTSTEATRKHCCNKRGGRFAGEKKTALPGEAREEGQSVSVTLLVARDHPTSDALLCFCPTSSFVLSSSDFTLTDRRAVALAKC